jgi:hypothetical protein
MQRGKMRLDIRKKAPNVAREAKALVARLRTRSGLAGRLTASRLRKDRTGKQLIPFHRLGRSVLYDLDEVNRTIENSRFGGDTRNTASDKSVATKCERHRDMSRRRRAVQFLSPALNSLSSCPRDIYAGYPAW